MIVSYDLGLTSLIIIVCLACWIAVMWDKKTGHLGLGIYACVIACFIIVLAVVLYDIWASHEVAKMMRVIEAAPTQAERDLLYKGLVNYIGGHP